MLEETITAALALLSAKEDPDRLEAILTTAREELSSREEADPQALQRQIAKAADLLCALYGDKAVDRAKRIAAMPGSSLFSRLVLAKVEARRSR